MFLSYLFNSVEDLEGVVVSDRDGVTIVEGMDCLFLECSVILALNHYIWIRLVRKYFITL